MKPKEKDAKILQVINEPGRYPCPVPLMLSPFMVMEAVNEAFHPGSQDMQSSGFGI